MSSRDYRLYAAGQVVSVSGTWMQKLAQSWLVLLMTNSPFMLGVTVACQQAPGLLFTATGGSLADRFDRRKILITTAVLAMLPAFALGAVIHFGVVALWMVLVAAVFQGLIDALDRPTRLTLVNDIVGPRLITNAVTLNNVIQQSGKLVGPAIAGVVIGAAGVEPAFFANAFSYVAVLVGLLLIRPAYVEERTEKARGKVRDTLRYVGGRRDLVAAFVLLAVIGLFGYNFQVLIPILMRNVFGGNASSVGLGLTSMGLGGVLGGLAIAGNIKGSARVQLVTAGCFGLTLLLTALSPTMWSAFVALFITGAASVTFQSASGAYLQLTSARHMRGRVVGLYVVSLSGTTLLGAPLIGAVAELTSARVGLLVAAAATGTACIVAYQYLRSGAKTAEGITGSDAGPDTGSDVMSDSDIRAVESAEARITGAA